ncbi:hypothetical protein GCM10009556_013450 [Acrocarpospora pleiomorpha]
MSSKSALAAVVVLSLCVAILFAGLAGVAAFLCSRAFGSTSAASARAGATAFTATLTLSLGVLALVAQTLG